MKHVKQTLYAVTITLGLLSVAHAQPLRFATEGAYPPFNYVDSNNQLRGFDVDMANALCARLSVECAIVAQDWEGIIPGLLAKKYDAIIASMAITEERQQTVSFTQPYNRTRMVLAVPRGSAIQDTAPATLAGKTVGAQSSSTQGIYNQDVYGANGARVKLYVGQDEANSDLLNGRLDAVVNDSAPMQEWLKSTDPQCCRVLAIPGTQSDAGIAVRKADEALRARLNQAIADVIADGTYRQLKLAHGLEDD
jgi:polar amino acid transport system substrate-binding protein